MPICYSDCSSQQRPLHYWQIVIAMQAAIAGIKATIEESDSLVRSNESSSFLKPIVEAKGASSKKRARYSL
jgi:hypothetical protein